MVLWLQNSSIVKNCGIGRDLLRAAKAMDPETLEMLVRLGSILDGLIAAKQEQQRELARMR
jgi:hypothetical protein